MAPICGTWEVPRSSFYDRRRLQATPTADRPVPRKRGSKTEQLDEDLADLIRALLSGTEAEDGITGEGYRRVPARLRFAGTRVGRERVLRVMREHGLLEPTRIGLLRGPRVNDGTVTTDRPDPMWGTDATRIATRLDGDVWCFAAVDHCNTEGVGIHAAKAGTRFEALVPGQEGVRRLFGSTETGIAIGLSLRHDHGTQYMSRAFQDELRFLGIESSPSFVAAPEGKGVAERSFRILEEQLLWVRIFDTVEDLRLALLELQRRFNERWILARHGYRTANQVRAALATSGA